MCENCALFADWPKSRQYVSSNKWHLIHQCFSWAQEKHLNNPPPTCTVQMRCRAESKVPVLVCVPVRDRWPISAWGKERDETWGNGRQQERGRVEKGREGRRTSSAWYMPQYPRMHTNTQLSGHERLAAGAESESDPGWSPWRPWLWVRGSEINVKTHHWS